MSRRFSFKRIAAFILICALLLAPRVANAGVADIISLLTTITGTIRNGIGTVLGGIQSIRTTVTRLEQQVVWPVAAINQAKSFVSQIRSQLTSAAQQVRQIRT
jgi:predicted PurR-regulated permease PerM